MRNLSDRPRTVGLTDAEIDLLVCALCDASELSDGRQRQRLRDLCERLDEAKRNSASDDKYVDAEVIREALSCLLGYFPWLKALAEILTGNG